MRPSAQLFFLCVFLVEVRFCHIGQVGLELLASSDPPASASKSAGITGVSHHRTWPQNVYSSLIIIKERSSEESKINL